MTTGPENEYGPVHGLRDEPPYRWPIPPHEGWTADDLDHIPDLPPRTELLDGVLVFRSPQTRFQVRCLRPDLPGLPRT